MDADNFLADFESKLRHQLLSIDLYRMRRANNDLLVSVTRVEDFLAIVRAASGANISLEVGWLFDPKLPPAPDIALCFLRFNLVNQCIDDRLDFFLQELK